MNFKNELENYIITLLNNSPYQNLSYQRKAILEGVQFFLYSFYMKPLMLRATFDDEIEYQDIQKYLESKWGTIEQSTFMKTMNLTTQQFFQVQTNNLFYNPFPVYSMDVGIGKTLIWLLSIVWALHCLKSEHLNIAIIIPPLIKPFYKEVIQNLKLPHHFTFITSPEDLTKKNLIDENKITSQFISETHFAISKDFDGWKGKKSLIKETNLKRAFKLNKHQYLALVLIDEFTSPINPLWSKKENYSETIAPYDILNKKLQIANMFGFWLSASKQHFLYGNNDNFIGMPYYIFSFPSEFIKKENVLKELQKKWLYHNPHFFIKHYWTSTNWDNDFWELFTQMKINLLKYEEKKNEYYQNFKSIIMELSNKINLANIDNIIKMIENYLSATNKEEKSFKRSKQNLEILLQKLKQDKFYSEPIEKIFIHIPFSELQQQKTLILLDDNWSKNKIKNFQNYLIENNHTLLSLENFQKEKKGVLIGSLDELWRGWNFQDFDNLIISYIADVNLEDIHQFFWRLDRIKSKEGKKSIFVYSYFWNNNLIEQYLENRKDISSEEYLVEVLFKEREKKIFEDLKETQQKLISETYKLRIEINNKASLTYKNQYEQELLNQITQDISSKIHTYFSAVNITDPTQQKNLLNLILKILKSNRDMIMMILENNFFQD